MFVTEGVKGNISSVKKSLLDYMESFIGTVCEPENYFPSCLVQMMTYATLCTGHEVAVLLDRKNRVCSVTVGDSNTVSFEDIDKRRGTDRLCGIRLIHTHPGGSMTPSSVDINTLKTMRLDAMMVVGVKNTDTVPEKPGTEDEDRDSLTPYITGLSAALLPIKEKNSQNKPSQDSDEYLLVGPELFRRFRRFNGLFDYAIEYDRMAKSDTINQENEKERAILVGAVTSTSNYEFGGCDETLAELRELAKTAGAEVVGVFTQRRETPDPRYYIGKGLAEDLALQRQSLDASLTIFDDELSASQINNLENVLGTRVIDRTSLVLDIFAMRARSKEGRLQVELAQQKYRLPRLMGQGHSLSRLGGGIGTRGPGETKLQSDRRHIGRRIQVLESELEEVSRKRSILRKERQKKEFPSVAIVGYTNAGKSSLQNALCNSDSFCEDELFATLDPSVRKMVTQDDRVFLLTDTVGFIRKLPHDLVDAFKSTLEETVFADLLLLVADASNPSCEQHINTVLKLLEEIGADKKPCFLVLNKWDMISKEDGRIGFSPDGLRNFGKIFRVSAKTGLGLSELASGITEYFTRVEKKAVFDIPYSMGSLVSFLHENGKIYEESYTETGVEITASLPDNLFGTVKQYVRRTEK